MKDLTRNKFGRLTAIKPNGKNKYGHVLWLCRCECGNEKTINANSLTSGKTKSCGCLNTEKHKTHPNRKTHGMTGTRLNRIWKRMKSRCTNEKLKDYPLYGGRGISVCDEWKNSFQAFYDWSMSHGYSDELTIDRIDVNGNYEPSNCRWITVKEQNNNRRNNRLININGEIKTASQWIECTKINRTEFYNRLRNGKTGYDLIAK